MTSVSPQLLYLKTLIRNVKQILLLCIKISKTNGRELDNFCDLGAIKKTEYRSICIFQTSFHITIGHFKFHLTFLICVYQV